MAKGEEGASLLSTSRVAGHEAFYQAVPAIAAVAGDHREPGDDKDREGTSDPRVGGGVTEVAGIAPKFGWGPGVGLLALWWLRRRGRRGPG